MNYLQILQDNYKYIATGVALVFLSILRGYFNGPRSRARKSMEGKIIIVTGSSEGIGKATALQLLEDGAKVIFACRSKDKTEAVINSIRDPKVRERAVFMQLDLSDFASVNSFIQSFSSQFNSLDILINNAGCVYSNFTTTKDGIEATLQVNTLSPMILTRGLLDLLNKSNGRVINVSSKGYSRSVLNASYFKVEDISKHDFYKTNYSAFYVYCISKLGNIFFTQYLDKYILNHKLNIKTASLHPGVIHTELFRDYKNLALKLFFFMIYPLFWFFSKTVLMGAQTTLNLCYLDDKEFKSGEYYSDCNVQKLMPHATDGETRNAFINYSRDLINFYGKDKTKFDFEIA